MKLGFWRFLLVLVWWLGRHKTFAQSFIKIDGLEPEIWILEDIWQFLDLCCCFCFVYASLCWNVFYYVLINKINNLKLNKQWYHCREWQNSKCTWILCGCIYNLQDSLSKQQIKTFGLNQKYFLKSLNTKLDHSPHRIKNEMI